jgi:hypothetical protein
MLVSDAKVDSRAPSWVDEERKTAMAALKVTIIIIIYCIKHTYS